MGLFDKPENGLSTVVHDVRVIAPVPSKPSRISFSYIAMLLVFLFGTLWLVLEFATSRGGSTMLEQQVRALWLINSQLAVIGLILVFGLSAIIKKMD